MGMENLFLQLLKHLFLQPIQKNNPLMNTMSHWQSIIFLLFTAGTALAGQDFISDTQPNTVIQSGVPWFDTDGRVMNCHGAGIIQVGHTYYLVGEKRDNNGFGIMGDLETKFIGVSLYASQDLVNWKHLADPLLPVEKTEIGPDCIVERPKLLYNKAGNEFVLYMHTWDKAGNVAIATSSTVEGPYTYRGLLKFENGSPVRGGDLGVFQDKDGSAYLLETESAIYQLSADYKSALSKPLPRPLKMSSTEAPAMFKLNDTYYFLTSRMTWWHNNDNCYATASSIRGPWTDRGIFCPEGSKTWNSQTTSVLKLGDARGGTCIYMGDRWSNGRWLAGVNVWQPLVIEGDHLSLPNFHPIWTINPVTGSWQDMADTGTVIKAVDITFSGAWKRDVMKSPGEDYTASQTKDNTATLTFHGKRARIYSVVDHSYGVMGVQILRPDGSALGPETEVDLYTDAIQQGHILVYSSPVLKESNYQLRVRITGLKNHYSSGIEGNIQQITTE